MFMLKSEGSLVRQNVLQAASNRKGIIGLLRAAGKFIFGMFTAGTQAPGQLKLIMPFIMGAIAGAIAAALLAKFAKGDDVISSGYGKRTLLMPEGAIALNDKETVLGVPKDSWIDNLETSLDYFEEIEDYTKCQEVQQLISKISG